MPAKRKTKADRVREQFGRLYRIGKARSGMQEADLADAFGISVKTLYRHKKEPEKITLGEFAKFSLILQWTDEETNGLMEMMR